MIEIVLRKMCKVTKHYGNFNLLTRNSLVKMVMNQAVTQHNVKAKTKKNRDLLRRISFRGTVSLLFVRSFALFQCCVPQSFSNRSCNCTLPQLAEGREWHRSNE